MFRRLRTWFAENKQWNQDHREGWMGLTEPDSGGLSPFQRGTEIRVRDILQRRGLYLVNRRVIPMGDDGEHYVVAEILPLEAKIWMYSDQTDVSSPMGELRLEEWDARTPEDHYARVTEFLESLPEPGGAL